MPGRYVRVTTVRIARSGRARCVLIEGMRLRVPSGSKEHEGPDAPGSSAARPARTDATDEVTAAPAPSTGRGPKLQAALRRMAIASAQLLLIVAAIVVVGWVIGRLWGTLLPVVLGVLFATVLWPPTRFLRNHGWPPALAASVVLVGFLALFGGLIAV